MDYKKNISFLLINLATFLLLSGCDTKAANDPLTLLGTPSDIVYYDSEYVFELGASGGTGSYRYRYIANPEDITKRDKTFTFNPVQMTVENTDTSRNKPSFTLRATPQVPAGKNIEDVDEQKLKYQIELTDGQNTILKEFNFTLKKNKLTLVSPINLIKEGETNNQAFDALFSLRKAQLQTQNVTQSVCRSIDDKSFGKQIKNGQTIYSSTIRARLAAPVSHRTVFEYGFSSIYNEGLTERSAFNIARARPNVDYLNEVHSVVFEPGEQDCLIEFVTLDDSLIEGNEVFSIDFTKRTSGFVSFVGLQNTITIKDNEPIVNYTPKEVTKNAGDSLIIPLSLRTTATSSTAVNVSIDNTNTSALDNQFQLLPKTGEVVFPAGEQVSSYSVNLATSIPQAISSSNLDSIVAITTDIDSIFNKNNALKFYKIDINEWPENMDINREIISTSANVEEVVDISSDTSGSILTLIKSKINNRVSSKIKAFNKNASSFGFVNTGDYIMAQNNLDLSPIAIVTDKISSPNQVAVVSSVNGVYGKANNGQVGGLDFIVTLFQKSNDKHYTFISSHQFGTEGDDVVTGAKAIGNMLYVYGNTTGNFFENIPGFEVNKGGQDGFLYQINMNSNTKNWSRFIGTANQDSVVDIDAGRSEIVVLSSETNTNKSAFIRKLSTSTGLDKVGFIDQKISTLSDDKPIAIQFDKNHLAYFALIDSNRVITTGDSTPSLTQDNFILPFTSDNIPGAVISNGTQQKDSSVTLNILTKNDQFILGGDTLGKFIGNDKKGTSGSDAFLSFYSSNSGGGLKFTKTLQFGTPGNDHLIDVEEISDRKFMVLWSEDYTSGTGATRYRISPFTPEGEKLSPDPL